MVMRQKISERAVEILVERHRSDFLPQHMLDDERYAKLRTWYDYSMQECAKFGYPCARYCSSGDILAALDEFQASQLKTIDAERDARVPETFRKRVGE